MWRELNKLYWQLCDPDFRAPAHGVAARVLPGRRSRQPARSRALCDATLDARRRLAVHPARQVPGARRQDAAHPRRPVPAAARGDRPADLPLLEPALGGVLQELPGLRGLSAALRRPRRAGAGGRVPAAAPDVPALGALLPGSARPSALAAIERDAGGRAPAPTGSSAGVLTRPASYAELEQVLREDLHAIPRRRARPRVRPRSSRSGPGAATALRRSEGERLMILEIQHETRLEYTEPVDRVG